MLNEKIVLDKIWFSAGSGCGHGEHLPPWSLLKALQNLSFSQCSYCLWRRCVNDVGQGLWVQLGGYGHFWMLGCNLPCPRDPLQHQNSSRKEAQALLYTCVSVVDALPGHVLFSFMSHMFVEHRECPQLAAAAGCRCGMGSIPLLCPAVPHLLCTRSLADLTQLGLPCVSWWLRTRGPWRGASLCQRHCARGPWVGLQSWSTAPCNSELRACAPVFCSTGPPECSLRGDLNKSHYSSLKKRSQIFLKRKKATSGHC